MAGCWWVGRGFALGGGCDVQAVAPLLGMVVEGLQLLRIVAPRVAHDGGRPSDDPGGRHGCCFSGAESGAAGGLSSPRPGHSGASIVRVGPPGRGTRYYVGLRARR